MKVRTPTLLPALACLALACLAPTSVRAQNSSLGEGVLGAGRAAPEARGVVDLPRLTSPITLDGMSDEDAWRGLEPPPLTMYEPSFRGTSDRRIEVRVAYDDDAIYASARFFHGDPSEIRAFSLTRDRWSGDDGFGVLLDTFNDNENSGGG